MSELRLMSKLKHANVMPFRGACLQGGHVCMLHELCPFSLHELLYANVSTGVRLGAEGDEEDGKHPPVEVNVAAHAAEPHAVHATLPLSEVVANWDELAEALGGSVFADMLA